MFSLNVQGVYIAIRLLFELGWSCGTHKRTRNACKYTHLNLVTKSHFKQAGMNDRMI
jgi:hypothetical protein